MNDNIRPDSDFMQWQALLILLLDNGISGKRTMRDALTQFLKKSALKASLIGMMRTWRIQSSAAMSWGRATTRQMALHVGSRREHHPHRGRMEARVGRPFGHGCCRTQWSTLQVINAYSQR
jgi:hypothetical protein